MCPTCPHIFQISCASGTANTRVHVLFGAPPLPLSSTTPLLPPDHHYPTYFFWPAPSPAALLLRTSCALLIHPTPITRPRPNLAYLLPPPPHLYLRTCAPSPDLILRSCTHLTYLSCLSPAPILRTYLHPCTLSLRTCRTLHIRPQHFLFIISRPIPAYLTFSLKPHPLC